MNSSKKEGNSLALWDGPSQQAEGLTNLVATVMTYRPHSDIVSS